MIYSLHKQPLHSKVRVTEGSFSPSEHSEEDGVRSNVEESGDLAPPPAV